MKDWWREKEREWRERWEERRDSNKILACILLHDLKELRLKPCLEGRRFDKFVKWRKKREGQWRGEKEEKLMPKPRERKNKGKWDIFQPKTYKYPFSVKLSLCPCL
jgi:hypothetical protein